MYEFRRNCLNPYLVKFVGPIALCSFLKVLNTNTCTNSTNTNFPNTWHCFIWRKIEAKFSCFRSRQNMFKLQIPYMSKSACILWKIKYESIAIHNYVLTYFVLLGDFDEKSYKLNFMRPFWNCVLVELILVETVLVGDPLYYRIEKIQNQE